MIWFGLNNLIFLFSLFISSHSYLRSSFFFRNRSVDAKECLVNNLKGQCMFSFECRQFKGKPLGICMERYYVGSCCYFNSSANELSQEILQENVQHNQQEIHQLDYQLDHSTNLTSQSNELRKKGRPNNQMTTISFQEENDKKISFYTSMNESLNNQISSNDPIKDKLKNSFVITENQSSNSIKLTDYSTKSNVSHLDQLHSIDLMETTNNPNLITSASISNSINYLSNSTLNELTSNSMSGLFGISAIISSEIEKQNIKQSTSPITQFTDKLIKKNFTYNQLTTLSMDSLNSIQPESTTEKSIITLPIEKYFKNQECGIQPNKKPKAKVVGGRNSLRYEWPWMVLIKESTWFGYFIKAKCGGVLIHPSYVLTAAHCNPSQILGSLFVILGEHNLNDSINKPLVRAVKRMIRHRDYNPNTFENDVALLELNVPIDFQNQPGVTPICLPDEETDVFEEATITGYGKLKYGGSIPSVLQVAKLPILDNKKCQEMYLSAGQNKKIRDTFLCAGYKEGDQQDHLEDSCEGDSGSPLMAKRKNGRWVLIATVSHGVKCSYLPGIYMRTNSYLSWIYNTIHANSLDTSSKKVVQRFRNQQ